MVKNYTKIALRNLKKHKGYSIINITGLALGMACCILILLWVQDELSYDRFHKNYNRLYQVVNQLDGEWGSSSPLALPTVLKKDFPEVEKATRFNVFNVLTSYKNIGFYELTAFADPDFLQMFSFPLAKGNPATALDITNSVVISEKAAKKYFKNEDPIGKVLKVNQAYNVTVTGVLKNIPSNSSFNFDLLIPSRITGEERIASWAWETGVFVMLKNNVNVELLKTKIAGTTKKYDTRLTSKTVINSLQPLSKMHLYGLNGTGPILYVYIFSAIAIIVLIVACINFINLMTAKASIRNKEIGIRKVVGADRKHIIYQFYMETFVITLFAFILSVLIVLAVLPQFNTIAERDLSLDLFTNPVMISGTWIIILLTTLVAGSYPAIMLSSFVPVKILKESFSPGRKKSSLRWFLVVVQFSVSVILIAMTITMNLQMNYISKKNLGFNREQVISLPYNEQLQNKYEAFRASLLQNNCVSNVTSATLPPHNAGNINPVRWEGRGPEQYEFMNYIEIDYDYIPTFEIKLAEGRNFSREFPTDNQNYIVNEAAVSFMKMKSPIGKLFSIWQNEGRIIGVVKNFHSTSLHNEITPVVMTFNRYIPHNYIFIRLKPDETQLALSVIEKIWTNFVTDFPFQYEFLDDDFRRQYNSEEQTLKLFQYFSLMAIFISCIGLFGLSAFVAQRRNKEVGIRKVAGASLLNILGLILKDFVKWITAAIIIAIPAAYYGIDKWLSNFAYHTGISWLIFAASGIIVIFISVLTVSWQAFRAAISNPIESLKYE